MSYTIVYTHDIYSIVTDKILIDNQKEIETLQEKTILLTLELKNREERINQLIEKMKGREKYMILFSLLCYHLQICSLG